MSHRTAAMSPCTLQGAALAPDCKDRAPGTRPLLPPVGSMWTVVWVLGAAMAGPSRRGVLFECGHATAGGPRCHRGTLQISPSSQLLGSRKVFVLLEESLFCLFTKPIKTLLGPLQTSQKWLVPSKSHCWLSRPSVPHHVTAKKSAGWTGSYGP